jgi:hypothetical protein
MPHNPHSAFQIPCKHLEKKLGVEALNSLKVAEAIIFHETKRFEKIQGGKVCMTKWEWKGKDSNNTDVENTPTIPAYRYSV